VAAAQRCEMLCCFGMGGLPRVGLGLFKLEEGWGEVCFDAWFFFATPTLVNGGAPCACKDGAWCGELSGQTFG
jgi:hypothetical protein